MKRKNKTKYVCESCGNIFFSIKDLNNHLILESKEEYINVYGSVSNKEFEEIYGSLSKKEQDAINKCLLC